MSWLTSLIAIIIALWRPLQLLMRGEVGAIGSEASFGLITPQGGAGKFDLGVGLRIYGPVLGGIIFKTVTGELAKRVRMKSLIPALHA